VARTVRLTARRAVARGIPPQLPADQVEAIPFFGRTWYVRGVDYWFRRVVVVGMALVGLATACAFEYGLLKVASGIGSEVGRWAWRAGWAALLVVSLIRPTRDLLAAQRRRRAGELLRPDWVPSQGRTHGGTGGGPALAAGARAGDTLSGALLVVGVVLFFGWFVTFLIFALQPEYGVEHDARLRLQRRRYRDTTASGPLSAG
jgi:hypothetical protein